MKCLCITGPSQQDLDQTLNILKKSGLALAKATGQSGTPDIYKWHEQALAILTRDPDADTDTDELVGARVNAPMSESTAESGALVGARVNAPMEQVTILKGFPNPHLDQLAQTIIDTHASHPLWGWANEHAVWLLDYWNEYNPDIHFILVACPPEHLIATLLDEQHQAPPTAAEIAALIDAWQDNIEAMLRFYYRNMSRCLLVDYQQLAANPKGLVQLCNDRWNLDLAAPKKLALPEPQYGDLAFYLGGQITQRFPEALSLRNELLASINAIPGIEEDALTKQQNIDSIIQGYQRLRDRSPELRKIGLLQEQYNRLDEYSKVTRNSYQAQYQDFMSRERKVGMEARELKTELAKARVLLAEQNQQLDAFTQNLAEKSEALANLEQQYLGMRGKLNLAEDTLEQMNKVKSDLQAKLSSVGEEKQEATEENELLLLQLHQVQEELEAVFLQHQQMGQQMERITQAKEEQAKVAQERQTLISQLTQTRDAQTKLANERQAELEKVKKQLEETNTSLLKEAEQENELLLLQLHQVQEELEHYFLQYQNLRNELDEAEAKVAGLYKKHPYLADYADVSVSPIEGAPQQGLAWQFNNLTLAGRKFEALKIETHLQQGMASLLLQKADKLLLRWPPAGNADVLQIEGDNPAASPWLAQLGNSDWLFIKALIKLLRENLGREPASLVPGLDASVWIGGLDALQQALDAMQPILRFDRVRLKHEQVNPDYEHLWLQLENLGFGNAQLPDFEFRLSCAHVSPGNFGEFPKLEFPESTSQGILDSWFKEADDEVGPRLELRYSVEHGPDHSVWTKLSAHDQSLVTALGDSLTPILADLQAQGAWLSRNLADWEQLAAVIHQQIMELTKAPEQDDAGQVTSEEGNMDDASSGNNHPQAVEAELQTDQILGALDEILGLASEAEVPAAKPSKANKTIVKDKKNTKKTKKPEAPRKASSGKRKSK
jgi:hypothetical protein